MNCLTPMVWVVWACLIWLSLLCFTAAGPDSTISDLAPASEQRTAPLRSRDNGKFLLRIMPLGASITLGYKSTDGNGYREWLRRQLRYAGWQVDMVGSMRNGTMHNNEHEGHVGFRVDQLTKEAEKTIPQQPNLILINAGTNDALQKHTIYKTGLEMDALLRKLYTAIPNTTIILSTLLPNSIQPKLVKDISEQYRTLAALRRARGDRLVLADMGGLIKEDQLVDGIHPTDYGYKEMAAVWWAAIQTAYGEGFLQEAGDTSVDGTISRVAEKKLDGGNSTSDPGLPRYSAPGQPTLNDASSRARPFSVKTVCAQVLFVLIGVFVVYR